MSSKSARLIRACVAVTALGLLAGACGDDGGGSSTSSGVKLVKSGTLTVCSDIPYAPFEYEEANKVVGIDADLVREMASGLSLQATFVDTDFDGIFAALAAKKCDMIASSVTITDERKKSNDFSDGYYEISQSLLVRTADAAKYTDLPALKGKTVGVQSETTGADFAMAQATANGYSVKEFTGADDMFTALKASQVDALLQDFPVNAYKALTGGDSAVTKVFDSEKESYGFVVPKSNPELTKALNAGLAAAKANGKYAAVLEKYLGKK
jgi:polar amino acid transport system substrate-binding protein